MTPNLTEVAKGSLVFGNRHPRYEGVSGWVREKIDKTIIEPILVDQKMIDGIYDQADDQAKNLLPGFVNNIKKAILAKPGAMRCVWRVKAGKGQSTRL